mgnify:FL=1
MLKIQFILAMVLAILLQVFGIPLGGTVFAANLGDVVINEVAWAGSGDNSNDEWIELYNTTSQAVDLGGWVIEDDGSPSYKIASGTVAPHGYFLIEDNENAISNVAANAVINLSLANAGDSLVLKNSDGVVVDKVNSGGGAWYAGDGSSKATMERIDPDVTSDSAGNFASAINGNGGKASGGGDVLGTPGGANSNYAGGGAEIYFNPTDITVSGGDTVTVGVYVDSATDLYAYGFEVNYPSNLVSFVSAKEAQFLKADGVNTAFNAALKNGDEGSLIIGNARLINPAKWLDGSGKLFDLTFEVVGSESLDGELVFGSGSFLSDSKGNVPVKFTGADLNIGGGGVAAKISSLKIDFGDGRYSFKLSWAGDANSADSYVVKRKMVDGNFVMIGETNGLNFVDDDKVLKGGKLVPGILYQYQVIPVKNNIQGQSADISYVDTRGIVGDNDRSDRVDGKDIENLARSYGSAYGDEEYNALADTNFDGIIDGKDLIDVGVNFGLSY